MYRPKAAMRVRAVGAAASVVVGSLLAASGTVPAAAHQAAAPTGSAKPAVVDVCPDGAAECVEGTISQMRTRFEPLGRACDHNAAFALTYLRTTQGYQWARDQPGFFTDVAWVNHESALFAQYYFDAYDAWAAGRRQKVPGAWLVAFDAGRDRRVTGAGNVLLGMSAHINRDLPYVLAAVGLTRHDGADRKPDHDKINEVLAVLVDPLLAELSTRFDPYGVQTGLPSQVALGLIAGWREQAWRNAQRLVAAPDPSARALVAAEIDAAARAQAVLYVGLTGYLPPLTTSKPRDAYCAGHHADTPPAYVFGTPPAY
jgi:hypothetical protein